MIDGLALFLIGAAIIFLFFAILAWIDEVLEAREQALEAERQRDEVISTYWPDVDAPTSIRELTNRYPGGLPERHEWGVNE